MTWSRLVEWSTAHSVEAPQATGCLWLWYIKRLVPKWHHEILPLGLAVPDRATTSS